MESGRPHTRLLCCSSSLLQGGFHQRGFLSCPFTGGANANKWSFHPHDNSGLVQQIKKYGGRVRGGKRGREKSEVRMVSMATGKQTCDDPVEGKKAVLYFQKENKSEGQDRGGEGVNRWSANMLFLPLIMLQEL